MAAAQSERREVFFRGRVQGVGFRYVTREIARRFPVTGFVENLHDGRVRLVIEGEPAEMDALIAAVCEAMARHIDDWLATQSAATGEFPQFEIRR